MMISDVVVLMMVAGAMGYMLRMFAPTASRKAAQSSGGCSVGGSCSTCGGCQSVLDRLAVPPAS